MGLLISEKMYWEVVVSSMYYRTSMHQHLGTPTPQQLYFKHNH